MILCGIHGHTMSLHLNGLWPIPVLPFTGDQMEAKTLFPEQCHSKQGGGKKKRYTQNLTQGAQKHLCKLSGGKGSYASKYKNLQVSSEKGASKYLHGLQVDKV